MIKKTFKISGMDCDSCAKMIELDLEDAGISAKCDYRKELLEIDLENESIEIDKIKKIVEDSGYNLLE